jgi:hypothetical protein
MNNENIEGDYVQGEKKPKEPKKTKKAGQTIGGNYVENLGGRVIEGDLIEVIIE